jgi:hypothetical protein
MMVSYLDRQGLFRRGCSVPDDKIIDGWMTSLDYDGGPKTKTESWKELWGGGVHSFPRECECDADTDTDRVRILVLGSRVVVTVNLGLFLCLSCAMMVCHGIQGVHAHGMASVSPLDHHSN